MYGESTIVLYDLKKKSKYLFKKKLLNIFLVLYIFGMNKRILICISHVFCLKKYNKK